MQQTQQLRQMAQRSAAAFLLAVLCVYPLYIDKFSNLGVVKFTGAATLCWAFCLWLGALAAVGARPHVGRLPWRSDPALWALGAVVGTGVLSTVTSLSPVMSLWGLGGYYGGCMMVLFTAASYLAVRAFAPQKLLNGLTFCVGITTALVTVLYVLNIFNIDLIGTYADTAVVERAQFFSTLGQKNFCSGFMAFALPLVFYAFLVARGVRHTMLYGIPTFFGALALAVVDADGLALGIGAAVLVLICQRIFTTRTLRRLAVVGMFFFADAGWMQYMRTHVYTQGGKPILASFGHYAQVGFAVCAAVWAVLFFALHGREIPLWKAGRVLAAVVVSLGVVLVVLANFLPGFPSLGQKLDDLLVFSDDWGTYRGTAWRISWSAWTAQPLWRKLVGVGPGMMHTAVAQWAGADITARMKTFYAAHNEYLELLLTGGVLSLAAWVWFVAAHLRKAAQNWLRPGVAPVTLALVSYLAHAAVSIRVSMIFPEIMLLFALLQVFCLPPEEDAVPAPAKGKKGSRAAEGSAQPGLIRIWAGPIVAAVVMMATCGAASRVVFGFLY
ncbi:MAG: O-antigen ligase family protein [Subdoligranulum variabile]|uniref:O-antigen ligase family protein n=1 Tax=Gemmiger sp. TaxID=2049027 RepID=UPI002A90FB9F|nr:O-antigen ligase family protein [Gemmiger sp.]MDD7639035.1 O-antigen ligase family protein [Subdoligranulum variabile]MDY5606237.1 O-antigen ligase family protein [Gemmiger sp.]